MERAAVVVTIVERVIDAVTIKVAVGVTVGTTAMECLLWGGAGEMGIKSVQQGVCLEIKFIILEPFCFASRGHLPLSLNVDYFG